MKEYEAKNPLEVDRAVDAWRTGESEADVWESGAEMHMEFPDEEIFHFETTMEMIGVLRETDIDALKLLELWIGYVQASWSEGILNPTVEDFVLATYIALEMDKPPFVPTPKAT